MQKNKLNTGIVYTNKKCIGCNKCISGCVATGANVVVKHRGSDRCTVSVDPGKCILCGNCVAQCVHKARTYRDDTEAFFADLAAGEQITLLVSPTLLIDYEKQYHNILGYLAHLGVRHIYNTAFGGDIMVWVYMNFIRDFGLAGVISQSCPVIVSYLEKYKPDLLPYLMPVQSPVMCTAIYVSDYLKNSDKLAYISPCIASKNEVQDVNTYGRVTYNVTIERLMEKISGVNLEEYHAEDELSYGLGALISMSRGLTDNIERYIGFNEVVIQTEGPNNIFPYFDQYYKQIGQGGKLPFLVDALSCTNGCSFGTGTNCGAELRNEMTFAAHRLKENAYSSGAISRGRDHTERITMLNKQFADFELSSFVRQYDATRKVQVTALSDRQIKSIYSSMYKYTNEQQHTDCGACGYQTCQAMANAIACNSNHKQNCINYSKERIRRETEKTNALLREISHMNEELKKATQLKSNFLANMSHEIRTPMNAIIGMAEMALRGDLPGEERGYIQQIKSSGRSLLAIINDILDFSKIESGRMELNESDYKVVSLLNDTVNIVMTRIGEKEITLSVQIDPNIPFALYGDDIRIKQVLVNLANNAIKFTESGCVEISIGHTRRGDNVDLTVAVRDTGIGIRPEDIEKLFSSFQQVDSKRNRNVEGTGLGLAISREFVRLMRGEIFIESKYGEGSCFSFRIPQRIVDPQPCVSLKEQRKVRTLSLIGNHYVREGFLKAVCSLTQLCNTDCSTADQLEDALLDGADFVFVDYRHWNPRTEVLAQHNKETTIVVIVDPRNELVNSPHVIKLHQPVYSVNVAAVLNREEQCDYDEGEEDFRFEASEAQVLIVDDNAINLTVAKGLLSPLKMQITGASGAREAISLIGQHHYDVVFMDHMMPDIDGVEATHIIRSMPGDYCRDLPIIALTANAINNAREMFLQEGMNDFVAKPIEMRDITAKLRRWLPAHKVKQIGKSQETAPRGAQQLTIAGLDTRAGISQSGSEELYRTILGDYARVIDKKAGLIQQYLSTRDLPGYTIEVHALKSASRLIGATQLSQLAAELEQCGHDDNWAPIEAQTEQLLALYRSYSPVLAPYCPVEEQRQQSEMDGAQLANLLQELRAALEDFDLDTAQGLMEQLQGCLLNPQCDALRQKLRDAVADMEYDDAAETAQALGELCGVKLA